ncbi:arylsulfotransferase family protein [Rhodoligotrophos defluvii]|uniref:arylsulfotransferase family protein n=1 Tax=Rhodoligotrophos defluvii TaxID=2561934 RepID=UPI0010C95C15|nr:arylsulfotransferase family protein [Rhodoligotrophos defluvii]
MGEAVRKSSRSDHERRFSADLLFRAAFVASIALLLFLAGSIATVSEIFPGPQIARAVHGGKALYDKYKAQDVYASDLWPAARRAEKGVTVNDAGKAQDGVVLYTSGSGPAAYLIDMDGQVLHTWQRPFSTVWPAGHPTIKKPQPDSHIYFRHAYAFPNGDLLALYEGVGDTPYGYGLVKLDKNSEVIWRYPGRSHHQFDVGPDGKIYVLTHEVIDDEVDRFPHLKRPRLEDFLVVLSPDGQELQKVRLLTSLAKSRYRQMLYTVSGLALDDPLHANSVTYIDRENGRNFPFGKEGQILLSFRETHAIVVLDLEQEDIVWATRGPWIGQHDPDILPNGNILLFDNFAEYEGPGGTSRVIEFDPRTMAIVWQYTGSPQAPLESRIRSDQQRLANGNTLITESDGGRIVEVTRDGSIAWEFMNPIRAGEGGSKIPIIAWAEKLDAARFDPMLLKPDREPRLN